jgi:hypothetical protein
MGPAVHKSSGELRLGLTAAAAAAVLYGAVVVFGLGPASPFGLSRVDEPTAPVVHVPHDPAAPGPALRLPQVSPGPERRSAQPKSRQDSVRVAEPAAAGPLRPDPPSITPSSPAGTSAPSPAPSAPTGSPTEQLSTSLPTTPIDSVEPVVPVVPDLTVPTVTLPLVDSLPPVPPAPELPAVPVIPLP